jgi:hypothetical protein
MPAMGPQARAPAGMIVFGAPLKLVRSCSSQDYQRPISAGDGFRRDRPYLEEEDA